MKSLGTLSVVLAVGLAASLVALVSLTVGKKKADNANAPATAADTRRDENETSGGAGGGRGAEDDGKMGAKDKGRQRGQYELKKTAEPARLAAAKPAVAAGSVAPAAPPADQTPKEPEAAEAAGERPAPTRSWFPETFLFEPLVVTDEGGAATLGVKVPDRLTTWHILALAHSRTGAQGGTVASFLGTLPTYVDPVLPKELVVGDEIRVPIQIVNTTEKAATGTLRIEAKGAAVEGIKNTVEVPGGGSVVEYARLSVDHPGEVKVLAAFGSTDTVLKSFMVKPYGKPVTQTKSGTLAAPRTLSLTGPAKALPGSDKVRLVIYPGALALLRAELASAPTRSGIPDDAYALLLAGRAPEFQKALGDTPDLVGLRNMSVLAGQRVIRDGRTLDVTTAAVIAEAALAHPENPVLSRLGLRAVDWLGRAQRPDGTFGGGNGWTLQRVLVLTAECTRAVHAAAQRPDATPVDRQRAQAVAVRAAGAFERNLDRIQDGYTAAAILASGSVKGEVADKLRARVAAALRTSSDGAAALAVDEGVVRGDNARPSSVEATALAVLALADAPDAKTPLADLGATVLGSYSQSYGWGDGRANLVCLQAVLQLFKDPVPPDVKITLTMDGKPITEGVLSRDKLREVLPLDADVTAGLSGTHEWKVEAEPAVPGLGYSLTLESWVPWEKEPGHGLELALPAQIDAEVGKPKEITMQAVAPAGRELHLAQALPAGVQVDTPSLQALVDKGTISRFHASEGLIELWVPAMSPGQTFAATYRVVATLAGKLKSGASSIEAGPDQYDVPPTAWTIK